MIPASKVSKYAKQRDEIGNVFFALDNLPDDPNTWSDDQRKAAHDLILRLGAPESFLRRLARADLV